MSYIGELIIVIIAYMVIVMATVWVLLLLSNYFFVDVEIVTVPTN